MGRWPWSGRYTVEDCDVLSVSDGEIKQKLKTFHPDSCFVVTAFRDGVEVFKQDVYMVRTPANFGGRRYWFRCYQCLSKVAKLYLPPNGRRYACRKCHDLTYRSQKEHDKTFDKYMKNPTMMRLLEARINAGDLKACTLVVRAAMRGKLK